MMASTSALSGHDEIRLLQGIPFSVKTTGAAIEWLDSHAVGPIATRVAIANANTLNIARGNARYRQVLSRFTVLNDGVGVDLASRVRYGQGFPDNLNGTDLVPAYLSQSALRLRIFMLGSQPCVIQRAFDVARRRYARHEWLGYRDGYFRWEDEGALCAHIRTLKPDLLLVAMGNPLQEFWIDRCAARTGAALCVGVGALFDFLSGEVDRAPLWIRRLKIEWIYRLAQEPGRLWRRYLIGNLTFLWHAWRERC
ncbi:MAG: WecB/TagA/CpsF family glycosyltransferase [Propionivibrio sp.]|uniref:WecB/TagA/CpsF family glycosyltransferase n=1 Tax=Propionivibrio sp. TaxID=2212460 RepID=UPI0025D3F83D|nr:WecB/TagA/CpsF family glycosyltransferase [Propionivibrio sp.]MBL0206878.1 WecB/TagA/CpsF family glycosyltransferase [Propionivibrio sp.]